MKLKETFSEKRRHEKRVPCEAGIHEKHPDLRFLLGRFCNGHSLPAFCRYQLYNGLPNACLQSWATFVGSSEDFYCIMASVNQAGHMYQTIKETGELVLNFPSAEYYDRCYATIAHNGFEDDEIRKSGLTAEPAATVHAPRIRECFLNLECQYLWEKELYEGSSHVVLALSSKTSA